ncbi:FLYWCH zinc finger domain-containing protein [Phthorimaea operculella]|nr:FLYWCH zinc finger domain-containing protein [Phthorimaea operculella]
MMKVLMIGNYRFNQHSLAAGGRIRWRCSKASTKKNCLATAMTNGNQLALQQGVHQEELPGHRHDQREPGKMKVLMIGNYRFNQHSLAADGRIRWRCSKASTKKNCLATAMTNGNQVVQLSHAHNHEPYELGVADIKLAESQQVTCDIADCPP